MALEAITTGASPVISKKRNNLPLAKHLATFRLRDQVHKLVSFDNQHRYPLQNLRLCMFVQFDLCSSKVRGVSDLRNSAFRAVTKV
jgi:hypothetical protein